MLLDKKFEMTKLDRRVNRIHKTANMMTNSMIEQELAVGAGNLDRTGDHTRADSLSMVHNTMHNQRDDPIINLSQELF